MNTTFLRIARTVGSKSRTLEPRDTCQGPWSMWTAYLRPSVTTVRRSREVKTQHRGAGAGATSVATASRRTNARVKDGTIHGTGAKAGGSLSSGSSVGESLLRGIYSYTMNAFRIGESGSRRCRGGTGTSGHCVRPAIAIYPTMQDGAFIAAIIGTVQ